MRAVPRKTAQASGATGEAAADVVGDFVAGIVEGAWGVHDARRSGTGPGDDTSSRDDVLRTSSEIVRFVVEHPGELLDLVDDATYDEDAPRLDRSRHLGRLLLITIQEVVSRGGTGGGTGGGAGGGAGGGDAPAATGLERVTAVAARTSRVSRVAAKLDAIPGTPTGEHGDHRGDGGSRPRVDDIPPPIGLMAALSTDAQTALHRLRRVAGVRGCGGETDVITSRPNAAPKTPH